MGLPPPRFVAVLRRRGRRRNSLRAGKLYTASRVLLENRAHLVQTVDGGRNLGRLYVPRRHTHRRKLALDPPVPKVVGPLRRDVRRGTLLATHDETDDGVPTVLLFSCLLGLYLFCIENSPPPPTACAACLPAVHSTVGCLRPSLGGGKKRRTRPRDRV